MDAEQLPRLDQVRRVEAFLEATVDLVHRPHIPTVRAQARQREGSAQLERAALLLARDRLRPPQERFSLGLVAVLAREKAGLQPAQLRLVEERLTAARLLQDEEALGRRAKALLVPPGAPAGLGEQRQVVRPVHLRAYFPAGVQAVTQEPDTLCGPASRGQGPAAQDRGGGGAVAEAVRGRYLEGPRRPILGRDGVAA